VSVTVAAITVAMTVARPLSVRVWDPKSTTVEASVTPTTVGLRSPQLIKPEPLERVKRIELSSVAWEAESQPLNTSCWRMKYSTTAHRRKLFSGTALWAHFTARCRRRQAVMWSG